MSERNRRTTWTKALAALAVLGIVALSVAGFAWHGQGGRWFVTTSPSMGEVLPVGTFLLTEPTTMDDVEVGDVITFNSPGSGTVFTHRVVVKDEAGLQTQGDVNAVVDPWVVTEGDLIGDVAWHTPILGWVVQAVPLLLAGAVVVWLLTRWMAPTRRRAMRLLGVSTTTALVGWYLSPWVGVAQLGQTTAPDGQEGVLMEVISTGLLPIQAKELDGPSHVHLTDGETGTLHLTNGLDTGAYDITAAMDLPWWGWVIMGLLCLGPLWLSLLLGTPEEEEHAPRHRAQDHEDGAEDETDQDGGPDGSDDRELVGSSA